MSELDWDRIREAKDAHRDRLAALSFAEKMSVLERLRARTLLIGGPASTQEYQLAVSNAYLALVSESEPASQVMRDAITAMNVGFFGAAPTFAVAIAPSQLSTVTATALSNRTE